MAKTATLKAEVEMPRGRQTQAAKQERAEQARTREREERARTWKNERLDECQILRVELKRAGPWGVLGDLLRGNPKGLRRTLKDLQGPGQLEFAEEELEHLAEVAAENLELFARGILTDGDLEAHLLPLRLEMLRRLIWKGEASAAARLAFRAGIDWERTRETMLTASKLARTTEEFRAHRARFKIGGDRRRGDRRVPDEAILQRLAELRKDPALGAPGRKMKLYNAAARHLGCSEHTVRRAVTRNTKGATSLERLTRAISGPNSGPNFGKLTTTRRK